MKLLNVIFYGIAIILVVLGFLSWRVEFELPKYEHWHYIIGGFVLALLATWGRVMAGYVMLASVLPFGYALFLLLFDKSSTWNDMSTAVFIGLGLLVFGVILYLIGSESFRQTVESEDRHSARKVFCAACDQYLGRAGGFTSPCPRCGSNRYSVGN